MFILWKDAYPVATLAEANFIETVLDDISDEDDISTSVANKIIDGLWKRSAGLEIANIGIKISEGQYYHLDNIQDVIDKIKAVNKLEDLFLPATNDIDELIKISEDRSKWKFNIKQLADRTPALGAGEFGIIFATPETGKTAFSVSISCGPNGFCQQGAKVVYFGNEEAVERTSLRAVSACTGMTKEAIINDPDTAKGLYASTRDKITFQNCINMTIADLDAYIGRHEPDIVIIDQADKISLNTDRDMPGHEKLKELYIQYREIAKRHNCAVYGVSQASADATNKLIITPDMMEGSKVGKFAQADLIIGIGKLHVDDPDDPNVLRGLYVGKNKLNGWHGQILCKIQDKVSRYVD